MKTSESTKIDNMKIHRYKLNNKIMSHLKWISMTHNLILHAFIIIISIQLLNGMISIIKYI